MGNNVDYIIPLNYLIPLLIGLICAFIALRGQFAQKIWFTQKAINDKKISNCLAPFGDAMINVKSGGFTHIRIMNSFFVGQEEAITIFTATTNRRKTKRIRRAWNKYKKYYEQNAKGQIYLNYASIPEPHKSHELNKLQVLLEKIIKEIKK